MNKVTHRNSSCCAVLDYPIGTIHKINILVLINCSALQIMSQGGAPSPINYIRETLIIDVLLFDVLTKQP